jgi:hypothetical protein
MRDETRIELPDTVALIDSLSPSSAVIRGERSKSPESKTTTGILDSESAPHGASRNDDGCELKRVHLWLILPTFPIILARDPTIAPAATDNPAVCQNIQLMVFNLQIIECHRLEWACSVEELPRDSLQQ